MSLAWTAETLTADVAESLKSEIIGKTVLITGVTIGGLGFEAAYEISKYAKGVILVGSNLGRLQKAEDKIHEKSKEVLIHKVVVDLSSLEAVRGAAAEINAFGLPIHVVIANARAPVRKEYEASADGFEIQFAVSHLAHFLLINSILPRVFAARSDTYAPRIVIIASMAHILGEVRFEDASFGGGKEYNPVVGYAQAKSANILYTKELAKRLGSKGLVSFAVHPGAIKTNGYESLGSEERQMMGAAFLKPDGTPNELLVVKRLDQGAAPYLIAAFDPRIKDKSGSYLSDDGQIHDEQVARHASDPDLAKQLWSLSEEMVEKTFEI